MLLILFLINNQAIFAQDKSEKTVVDKSDDVLYLLNGPENPLKYWKFFSGDEHIKLEDTFYIATNGDPKEPVLVCKGKPFGYLRFKEDCENYDFSFEWKYAKDPNGNSGVLIHVNGDNKIWPKAMQIQLHRPTAGSIFPSGGAKSDSVLKVKDTAVKETEWNTCLINSNSGKITVTINGIKQGEVTGCDPPSGTLALQSEGAEIHFRKLTLRKYPATNPVPVNVPAVPNNNNSDITKPKVAPQSKLFPGIYPQNRNLPGYKLCPQYMSHKTLEIDIFNSKRDFRQLGIHRNDRRELKRHDAQIVYIH